MSYRLSDGTDDDDDGPACRARAYLRQLKRKQTREITAPRGGGEEEPRRGPTVVVGVPSSVCPAPAEERRRQNFTATARRYHRSGSPVDAIRPAAAAAAAAERHYNIVSTLNVVHGRRIDFRRRCRVRVKSDLTVDVTRVRRECVFNPVASRPDPESAAVSVLQPARAMSDERWL